MIKQKVYDIANSNIENLGSDLEREVKKASAEQEVAWQGIGNDKELKIWRIEKFHVVPWPEKQYGSFYTGDSYIIYCASDYDGDDVLEYDIHFWLGQDTTLDEAGTAAYKTVELDTFLDDRPIQHREVEGFESSMFLSYFPNGVVILEGGVDSGFNHVEPESYQPRLLKIKGKFRHVTCRQVPLDISSLNSDDVFLVDLGLKVFQFNGSTAGAFEKNKAANVVAHLKEQRETHIDLVVIDQDSPTTYDPEFWEIFGGEQPIPATDKVADDQVGGIKKLFRLSDAGGELTFEPIAEGEEVNQDLLSPDDAFVLDKGHEIIVWIGSKASAGEKSGGLKFAQRYCADNYAGLPLSISVLHEKGCTPRGYRTMFE